MRFRENDRLRSLQRWNASDGMQHLTAHTHCQRSNRDLSKIVKGHLAEATQAERGAGVFLTGGPPFRARRRRRSPGAQHAARGGRRAPRTALRRSAPAARQQHRLFSNVNVRLKILEYAVLVVSEILHTMPRVSEVFYIVSMVHQIVL